MDEESLKRWLTERLTSGIEVNNQFPCQYNEHGFGYEIVLKAPDNNRYSVILTKAKEEELFVIRKIFRVLLHKSQNEEINIEDFTNNTKIVLIQQEARRYTNDPLTITITGTLKIQ